MNAASSLTRRALITTGGATVVGAGVLALAACASTSTGLGSETGGGSGPGAGDGTGSDGGPGSGSSAPEIKAGTEVAKLSDIPVGGTRSAKIGTDPLLLAQPTAGNVVCFSAICPHQGCTVGAAAKEFDCPCHGSKFDAGTGKVLNGPAVTGLTTIRVTVSGDSVVTA